MNKTGGAQSQLAENHNAAVTISIKTPAEEKALQAVDFVSWAIFRKYELKDEMRRTTIS